MSGKIMKKKNLFKSDSSISTCIACGSFNLRVKHCPNYHMKLMKRKDSVDDNVNISLYSKTMSYFVGETLSTAVLDSGCTKNVLVING